MSTGTRLDGQVVLVTGGGQGIGRAIAERMGSEGAGVAACDVDEVRLREAVAALEELGIPVIGLWGDVRSSADVASWVEQTEKALGPVDVLVNNAGAVVNKPFAEQSEDEYNLVVDVNVKGTLHCCRAVLPSMIERRTGNIVNIASMAGLKHLGVTHMPYAVAKAGIVALSRDLAPEVGRYGIRVNTIAPGPIRTQLAERTLSEAQFEAFNSKIALGRWGMPDEVAQVALFLASSDSGFVTGATLAVSGG